MTRPTRVTMLLAALTIAREPQTRNLAGAVSKQAMGDALHALQPISRELPRSLEREVLSFLWKQGIVVVDQRIEMMPDDLCRRTDDQRALCKAMTDRIQQLEIVCRCGR